MHSRSAQNVDTFNSNSKDHNVRILVAIADLDSQEVPKYEAPAKMHRAQPCSGGIRHKLSLEVKQQPNFDKHSARPNVKFCSVILAFSDPRDPSDPCKCEKHRRRDTRGRVRKALG